MRQYIGEKDYQKLKEEQHRRQVADQQAHAACVLLRKQLAEQEMKKRLDGFSIVNGQLRWEDVPYQFSTKEQYKQFVKEHMGIWI